MLTWQGHMCCLLVVSLVGRGINHIRNLHYQTKFCCLNCGDSMSLRGHHFSVRSIAKMPCIFAGQVGLSQHGGTHNWQSPFGFRLQNSPRQDTFLQARMRAPQTGVPLFHVNRRQGSTLNRRDIRGPLLALKGFSDFF